MPVEHGAWGILLVPFSCAAILARVWEWPVLLALVGMLALFLLRVSVESQGWESWSRPAHLTLAGSGALAFRWLIFVYGRYQLLWVGAIAVALYLLERWLAARHLRVGKEKRSLAVELIGTVLLTAAAPAAWISARGALDAAGLGVWLANLLFFLGGVLYVKYRVRGVRAHKRLRSLRARLLFAWPVVAYHLFLVAFVFARILLNSWPAAILLAFLPSALRGTSLLFRLGQGFPIRRLGWSEVAHSLVFAALLILVFRSPV